MSRSSENQRQLLHSIPSIEKALRYTFTTKALLLSAFTHRSYLNETASEEEKTHYNERLEFLGDAVINLYVTESLFCRFPTYEEGLLSKNKAALVSEKNFAMLIDTMNIAHYLLMGRGERIQHSYQRPSIAADLFEAIVGAIYLDGGYEQVTRFAAPLFTPLFESLPHQLDENPKAALQELFAKSGLKLPEYELLKEDGPQHMKQFEYAVAIEGNIIARGVGETKKEAQKRAAKSALDYIQIHGIPKKK